MAKIGLGLWSGSHQKVKLTQYDSICNLTYARRFGTHVWGREKSLKKSKNLFAREVGMSHLGTALMLAPLLAAASVSIDCRTEFQGSTDAPYKGRVFGVDAAAGARLSWTISAPGQRGVEQAAWEVQVQTDGGDVVWNSNQTQGNDQFVVSPPLEPDASYTWRVRVWVTGASEPTAWGCDGGRAFDTAPEPSSLPGAGAWVGGGGQLRAQLRVPAGKVVRARAWVSGLGAFYFFVNGQRIGGNIMDPPQSVYSKTVMYRTFDLTDALAANATSWVGAILGNYKWGYTDLWCNMTAGGGPDGCRALLLRVNVTMEDGTTVTLDTTDAGPWECREGPVLWDHFFHGETFDGRVDYSWFGPGPGIWNRARAIQFTATAPESMQVLDKKGAAVAVGQLKPTLAPPLRVTAEFPAISVTEIPARAGEKTANGGYVFDFGQNMGGMVRLSLPARHGLPSGTQLRIEHAEIVQGRDVDISGMCAACPDCGPCSGTYTCDSNGEGGACNTYCRNPSESGGVDDHSLRNEPCYPHQSYTPAFPPGAIGPHETPDRYIGDFNDANMTNLYTVRGGNSDEAEEYTPYFAAAGFRFAQLKGLPSAYGAPDRTMLTALRVHSNVAPATTLTLPPVKGTRFGTPDVLSKIHSMTLAAQTSNLWSIPTDCPQRERRGWLGDAQTTSDEAGANFDMQTFYEEFLGKMGDDQARWDGNNPSDTGALPDVVPYDGIGGNPGCPVWQVAYIVIARQLWKQHGDDALPQLRENYPGLERLIGWFDRRAAPTGGLLNIGCYGEWMGFNPGSGNRGGSSLTPPGSVSAYVHVLAKLYMSEIAGALGNQSGADTWAAAYQSARATYHERFFSAAQGGYSPCVNSSKTLCYGTSSRGSQTSNAMALAIGAPPDEATARLVAKSLADDVLAFGNRTTAGVTGMSVVFAMLDRYGYGDIALATLANDAYPSLGHMAHQNQTTLCENWACTLHSAGGGSQNHIMLGGFDAWLVANVGGLETVVNGSTGGWREIEARVSGPVARYLGEAAYRKVTRFGVAEISWRYDASTQKIATNVTVPVGSMLNFYSPTRVGTGTLRALAEGRQYIWSARGLTNEHLPSGIVGTSAVRQEGGIVGLDRSIVTRVGPGHYEFIATYA